MNILITDGANHINFHMTVEVTVFGDNYNTPGRRLKKASNKCVKSHGDGSKCTV